jgi:hypothetical protein
MNEYNDHDITWYSRHINPDASRKDATIKVFHVEIGKS